MSNPSSPVVGEGTIESVISNGNNQNTCITPIKNLQEFFEVVKDLSHFKVKRRWYDHHFIVSRVKLFSVKTIMLLFVVHYTSSSSIFTESDQGIGKYIQEVFLVHRDEKDKTSIRKIFRKRNPVFDLLNFKNGVFLVDYDDHSKSEKIYKGEKELQARSRIKDRLNETAFFVSWNNCEHACNHILTGRSTSEQANSKRTIADIFNEIVSEIKDLALRTLISIAFLASLSNVMVRHAYVRVIIAAYVTYIAEIGKHEKCQDTLSQYLIKEAREHIIEAKLFLFLFPANTTQKINDLTAKITEQITSNTVVCEVVKNQAKFTAIYLALLCFVVWILLETLYFALYYHYTIRPVRNKWITISDDDSPQIVKRVPLMDDQEFQRIRFMKLFVGYLSGAIAIPCGVLGLYIPFYSSSVWFTLFSFGGGFGARIVFICVIGKCYDWGKDRCACSSVTVFIIICLAAVRIVTAVWI